MILIYFRWYDEIMFFSLRILWFVFLYSNTNQILQFSKSKHFWWVLSWAASWLEFFVAGSQRILENLLEWFGTSHHWKDNASTRVEKTHVPNVDRKIAGHINRYTEIRDSRDGRNENPAGVLLSLCGPCCSAHLGGLPRGMVKISEKKWHRCWLRFIHAAQKGLGSTWI